MSKKQLLILLCIGLIAMLSAEDFAIGSGTDNQNFVPLSGNNNYGWSKFFYTSAELAAAGMSGTTQISQIGFQLTIGTWNNYVTDNQQVYIRNISESTYASNATNYPGTGSFTQVFNGSISWNGPGWVVITLDVPYSHNSATGMEILWENRDGSGISSPPKFMSTNTSTNYRAVHKYQDASFPAISGTRTYYRPNIRLISPTTGVITTPWTENFDSASFPPDSNWLQKGGLLQDPIVLNESSMWVQDNWLNLAGSDKAAGINVTGSINGWLITPLFSVSDQNHWLTFDLAMLNSNQSPTGTPPPYTGIDDRFAVLISDGDSWSTANIVREWNNTGSSHVLNNISLYGDRVAIPLSGHTGNIRIAFFAGSTVANADCDFMINNLSLGAYLPEPNVSIEPGLEPGTCLLAWSAVTGANSYQLYWADTPNGPWNLLLTTSNINHLDNATAAKRFYRVVAISSP